jgi:hypothetical protein
MVDCLNQLGIVWSNRGEHDKALTFLKQADETYNNCKQMRDKLLSASRPKAEQLSDKKVANTVTAGNSTIVADKTSANASNSSKQSNAKQSPSELKASALADSPIIGPPLFSDAKQWPEMEKLHTLTLYYLAQVLSFLLYLFFLTHVLNDNYARYTDI